MEEPIQVNMCEIRRHYQNLAPKVTNFFSCSTEQINIKNTNNTDNMKFFFLLNRNFNGILTLWGKIHAQLYQINVIRLHACPSADFSV